VRVINPTKIDDCCVISSDAKVKAHDDPEVLGPVPHEHLERDEVHAPLPSRAARNAAIAPRENAVMCSARWARSAGVYPCSGTTREITGHACL
jgi:hypothetical protein